mmetsp:Transcript_1712/g.4100  ORF Transcript_1712/g.4100 Transcript_1712/m.4100 type:complete len:249 (-) Transcript_1712:847-1593(-)
MVTKITLAYQANIIGNYSIMMNILMGMDLSMKQQCPHRSLAINPPHTQHPSQHLIPRRSLHQCLRLSHPLVRLRIPRRSLLRCQPHSPQIHRLRCQHEYQRQTRRQIQRLSLRSIQRQFQHFLRLACRRQAHLSDRPLFQRHIQLLIRRLVQHKIQPTDRHRNQAILQPENLPRNPLPVKSHPRNLRLVRNHRKTLPIARSRPMLRLPVILFPVRPLFRVLSMVAETRSLIEFVPQGTRLFLARYAQN